MDIMYQSQQWDYWPLCLHYPGQEVYAIQYNSCERNSTFPKVICCYFFMPLLTVKLLWQLITAGKVIFKFNLS